MPEVGLGACAGSRRCRRCRRSIGCPICQRCRLPPDSIPVDRVVEKALQVGLQGHCSACTSRVDHADPRRPPTSRLGSLRARCGSSSDSRSCSPRRPGAAARTYTWLRRRHWHQVATQAVKAFLYEVGHTSRPSCGRSNRSTASKIWSGSDDTVTFGSSAISCAHGWATKSRTRNTCLP